MKKKIPFNSVSEISRKFKSVGELPAWLKGIVPSQQIRLVRITSGMTQEQLARKMKTVQGSVAQIEQAPDRDLRIFTLQKIAAALDCELVVRLVPKQDIEELLRERSLKKARELIALSSGNAALELQLPDKEFVEKEILAMQKTILEKHRSALWED